jgi:UDP-N-acetylglucosamine 4,6-dehydratase/5-epimerase
MITLELGNFQSFFNKGVTLVDQATNILKGKSLLITGGTGSFGQHFIKRVLSRHNPRKIIVFSRDELKQHEMKQREEFADERLRWFIGDVRDRERLSMAFAEVDVVIHAAALKQVDTGEYNPIEFIKTNVLGSQNVVEICLERGVKKVIALSTDKASSPVNLYGATKLTADKLFVSANNYGARTGTSFSVVRYGNVAGSRGSVIPIFKADIQEGRKFKITDKRMTRFWITLDEAADFVLENLHLMKGGEIFVPIIPSSKIIDLAAALDHKRLITFMGIRPGEKLHEEMISEYEAHRTIKWKDRYVILPDWQEIGHYPGAREVEQDFAFRSDTNPWQLTIEELRKLVGKLYPRD